MLRTIAGCVLLVSAISGCSSSPPVSDQKKAVEERPQVYVVSYPLAYFSERIGGDLIDVEFPVPEDVEPKNWNPDGDAIAAFQSASLVLLNGADYAKWTLRATLPRSRTIVTTRNVEDQYLEIADAVTHTHGPEGQHEHSGMASETWLNPKLAIAQAEVIQQEISKLVPDSADAIASNFDSLRADLEALDREIEAAVAAADGPWIASHPVYDYLNRRYALDLHSMHWEPDEMPSDEQWSQFEELVKSRPASIMLWEDDPLPETARRLEQLGVTIAVFRIGDQRPATGDYLDLMRSNLKALNEATSSRPSAP